MERAWEIFHEIAIIHCAKQRASVVAWEKGNCGMTLETLALQLNDEVIFTAQRLEKFYHELS